MILSAIGNLVARVRSDERGFTLVEAVVAGLIMVIGALATLQLFDAGTRNTYRAEQSQVVNNRLQAELEEIKALPYDEIAMTSAPAASPDSNDPRWRVSGASFAINRDGSSLRQMVVNGQTMASGEVVEGGAVDPTPEPFTVGDVSGHIYKFVTWAPSPCASCGTQTLKRIVVAAKLEGNAIAADRRFQEVHTDVADPDAVPEENPGPGDDEDEVGKAEFWLTDTPCTNNTRQPLTGDHAAHNTRGVCSAGMQTGSTRGAPDLMFPGPPALDENYDPGSQPLFDYATDSEPATNANLDKGLLSPWASNDSCLLSPVLNTLDVKRLLEGLVNVLNLPALPGQLDGVLDLTAGDANKHLRMHTWVSPPVQGSGGVLLGRGTLELYTKTVNGAVHPGEICAWLSVRQSVTIPAQLCVLVCVPLGSTTIEVDLPMINVGILTGGQCRTGLGLNLTSFQHSQNPWPAQWTKLSVPMCFAAVNAAGAVVPAVLPPNSRVVLTVMTKQGGTQPGQALEFMYDHPDFESRLQLETNKLITFG